MKSQNVQIVLNHFKPSELWSVKFFCLIYSIFAVQIYHFLVYEYKTEKEYKEINFLCVNWTIKKFWQTMAHFDKPNQVKYSNKPFQRKYKSIYLFFFKRNSKSYLTNHELSDDESFQLEPWSVTLRIQNDR